MKTLLRISLIAAIALTINACGSKTPSQTTNHRLGQVTEKPGQSEAEKPNNTEEATISEDSTNQEELNKIKDSLWWETERSDKWLSDRDKEYAKERERFAKVLQQASDKELFIVLKYAIAHRYVPNRDIDPYSSMFVLVGRWQRSLMVYEKLSDRKVMLRKIYPDLKVLDDYLRWNGHGKPYPDTIVSQAILDNVGKNSQELDSIVGTVFDESSLAYKYFGTPLMSI